MHARRWRAVVFDLDDTLYPERAYVASGFRAVARWAAERLGIPEDVAFQGLQEVFNSGVRGNIFDLWLDRVHCSRSAVAEMIAVYRSHEPTIELFPTMAGLLRELRGKYRLGVVSDGYLAVQAAKARALGLDRWFDSIIFSDELGREHWKPSSRPFQEILARLGVDAHQAVYVADNPLKDFLGARSVGMFTVWAKYSDGDYCRLDAPSSMHSAEATVRSLPELSRLFLN